MKVKVLRQHYDGKQFWEGDIREMSEAAASELLLAGLVAKAPEGKAAPENKATKPKATK